MSSCTPLRLAFCASMVLKSPESISLALSRETKCPAQHFRHLCKRVVEGAEGGLVAYEAHGKTEARQLLKEEWFRDDLANKKLCPQGGVLAVREASPEEMSTYEKASKRPRKEMEELFLAYLK